MGFWSNLLGQREQPVGVFTPNVTYVGSAESAELLLGDLTPAQMWATQPHLRTVVSFLARNIAQLGLHSYRRDGEDRVRDRDSVFAQVMRSPNPDQTAYDLAFSLVGDLALYDRAYWFVGPSADTASGWIVRRLPPSWVRPVARDAFGVKSYDVTAPDGESTQSLSADQVLAFTGYHPGSAWRGSSTVEALKETLSEQIEAARYRSQVWKRGGRVSAVLQRPKDAPQWSQEAREAFRDDWYSKYTGKGSKAGGTPILEDGMTLNRIDFNAQEQQFVEAAKLAFSTVAAAFHVNPTMVGVLDNANYSNVREFRRMLYGDTLGPLIAQIEDRVNTFLLPMLGMDNAQYYAEFNIAEKLQGSFEEQASVMQTLVGAPLMTRNEGRAKFNLPGLPDGDGLVTPLNVLIGGQASPTDSGSQNEQPKIAASPQVKALAEGSRDARVAQVLSGFFARQGRSVLSQLAARVPEWWDRKRWDDELSSDLLKTLYTLAGIVGAAEAKRLGYDGGYSPDRTVEFLSKVSRRYAENINETTRSQVAAARDGDGNPSDVFKTATDSRADGVGQQIGTWATAFGTVEAAKQIAYDNGVQPTKTWVTGSNPRPEHAALNGQTVGIDETFSSGAMWPGEDGEYGCNCTVSISIPEE